MKQIFPAFAISIVCALAGCAPTRPIMHMMSERERRDCEAQGGSVQPSYAEQTYVCYFSDPPAPVTPKRG